MSISQINTNLQALTAQSSLNSVNSRLADTQLQLSTGLRINRAEDDAAGFSIASKLSSRLEGMDQAMRNIGDAKSVLDIAETGMNSIMDILIDMKSKAVQGSNDTLGDDERGFIADQITALGGEIDELAANTTFQGIDLLDDGAGDVTLTFQVGEGAAETLDVTLTQTNQTTLAIDTGIGALDGTDSTTFNSFISDIDAAIETLAGNFNQIGIDQSKLSIREENLDQAITSNSAARSRIQDADFAKVQSESVKLQILQQTATSALAQANTSPQSVLGFLG
ncbi:flagellin [Rhodohalobacter mucosus]|uniref:Flagellin n=1 Tax=Rhodohalobacter mucosus TaxID=2079485 RepID=A0A316TNI8_9BACT|nr:flagellin [Rhodohalobacter mucosus]PWN05211.1 flagellin [Rhodohalobacter mucosus]